jgi:hypothetical protein
MPLFDHYIMIDWTGGNSRRVNRPDAIWVASGEGTATAPSIDNPASRSEATALVLEKLKSVGSEKHVLVCFDFAYGYPAGFGTSLVGEPVSLPSWLGVWRYIQDRIKDDLGRKLGNRPSNKSNRFAVASEINRVLTPEGGQSGPFWCLPRAGQYNQVPQACPSDSFLTRQGPWLRTLRETDRRARSSSPFSTVWEWQCRRPGTDGSAVPHRAPFQSGSGLH